MERAVKAGERWVTFIFDGIDCADMGVYSITNGGTYSTNLTPKFDDTKLSPTAYDGQYYYGTQMPSNQFNLTLFAEDLSITELSRLKTWLNPRHIGKIIFSDQPYKYYLVKPTNISALDNYPLSDIQHPIYSNGAVSYVDNPVYTGKFNVTFETVGSAYGYGLNYFRDDLIYDAKNYYGANNYPDNYYYDGGLLYKDMSLRMKWTISPHAEEFSIPLYNPGDAKTYPNFKLILNSEAPDGSILTFNNKTTGESCIVNISGLSGEIKINFTDQTIKTDTMTYYGRITGTCVSVSPRNLIVEIPESITDSEGIDYNSIFITHEDDECIASINPLVLSVNQNWKNKYYLCINGNGGAMIEDVMPETNELLLDPNVITYDIPEASGTTPAGFKCEYTGAYDDLEDIEENAPDDLGNVANTTNNEWYIYRQQWEKTNLFNSPNQFKNEYGEFVPKYLMFGANLIQADDMVVSSNLSSQFELSAEILPRYL